MIGRTRTKATAGLFGILLVAGVGVAAPSYAVTSHCTTGKYHEIGWANCTGSGGYFRIRLDCPWSRDTVSAWNRLRSTNTYVQQSCAPWDVRGVTVETKSG